MRRRLYHPLWVHLPAVLVLVVVVTKIIQAMPLPNRAPIHFGLSGRPDNYGSPLAVFIAIILLSIVYIGVSVIIDELWARQEKRKTFNWMSLFDDLTVGLIGALALDYLRVIRLPEPMISFPWRMLVVVMGPAVALAVVLELLRPWQAKPEQITHDDTTEIRTEIGRRIESGQPWVYWETQNPPWNSLLVALSSGVMLLSGVLSWGQAQWWATGLLFLGAAAVLLAYGGLRVLVNENRVMVKLGVIGIPLLRLNTDEITDVQVHSFSPLRDFGGYGIRINREMKAYFFRGNRGVKVRTIEGKQYLIGSDHPEKLAAVIGMVSSAG